MSLRYYKECMCISMSYNTTQNTFDRDNFMRGGTGLRVKHFWYPNDASIWQACKSYNFNMGSSRSAKSWDYIGLVLLLKVNDGICISCALYLVGCEIWSTTCIACVYRSQLHITWLTVSHRSTIKPNPWYDPAFTVTHEIRTAGRLTPV